jgi:hypothetical protein
VRDNERRGPGCPKPDLLVKEARALSRAHKEQLTARLSANCYQAGASGDAAPEGEQMARE